MDLFRRLHEPVPEVAANADDGIKKEVKVILGETLGRVNLLRVTKREKDMANRMHMREIGPLNKFLCGFSRRYTCVH